MPRGEAGIRIMIRADISQEQLAIFAGHVERADGDAMTVHQETRVGWPPGPDGIPRGTGRWDTVATGRWSGSATRNCVVGTVIEHRPGGR